MIFILEDDKNIRKLLSYAIEREGFKAECFEESQSLYVALKENIPRLILLDIMLPGEDGFSVLKKLKSKKETEDIPVIVLTAKNSEIDKLRGLDGGADDYVTKPFGITELMARIRAVLRRCEKKESKERFSLGTLSVDNEKHVVAVGEEKISLSKKEYDLLLMLLKADGKVCSREELLEGVWGVNYGESRTLDVHIRKLRKKLTSTQATIETVKTVGYRLLEADYEA